MNWIKASVEGNWRSGPYLIVRNVAGYEAWIYSKARSGCLGRRMTRLDEAKALCEKDAAKPVGAQS
jgi:hypothetical protein